MFYLDVGNTSAKLGKFIRSGWKIELRVPRNEYQELPKLLRIFEKRDSIIACSVVDEVSNILKKFTNTTVLTLDDIPIDQLSYQTPHTLGLDRFFACFGAWGNSKSAVIVIDAGSAVTIDLMDSNGVYQGGIIAPGLRALEIGMKQVTPTLPQVDRGVPVAFPGKTTYECIQWGISGFYIEGLKAFINKYKLMHPDASIWLTGGDLVHLEDLAIDVRINGNLVLDGLHQFMREKPLPSK